jgi:hypothetical protein
VAFRTYRILCSTSPDLEPERLVFEDTLADFGEHVTFPQEVLFAGASFRPPFDAERLRASVESNIRMCTFYVHIFPNKWPGPVFSEFIEFARVSKNDPSRPLRQFAVFFKNHAAADEQMRACRQGLASGGECEIRDFEDAAGLEHQMRLLFADWFESVQQRP